MKIREKKTGAIAEVNDSFGMRMIEQGRAVLLPEQAEKHKRSAKTAQKGEETAEEA